MKIREFWEKSSILSNKLKDFLEKLKEFLEKLKEFSEKIQRILWKTQGFASSELEIVAEKRPNKKPDLCENFKMIEQL